MSKKDRAKGEKFRKIGKFTMLSGGVIGLAGMGVALGFTARGNLHQKELIFAKEQLTAQGCSRTPGRQYCSEIVDNITNVEGKIDSDDKFARFGGIAMLTGILVIGGGGVLYHLGIKRLKHSEFVLAPTLGGAVLSGRF